MMSQNKPSIDAAFRLYADEIRKITSAVFSRLSCDNGATPRMDPHSIANVVFCETYRTYIGDMADFLGYFRTALRFRLIDILVRRPSTKRRSPENGNVFSTPWQSQDHGDNYTRNERHETKSKGQNAAFLADLFDSLGTDARRVLQAIISGEIVATSRCGLRDALCDRMGWKRTKSEYIVAEIESAYSA